MRNPPERLIFNGTSMSEPGTMGGNTKIALEMMRELCRVYDVHVVLPERKVRTVAEALGADCTGVTLHPFPAFDRNEFVHPIAAVRHYLREVGRVFRQLDVGPADKLISVSDFHGDAVPSFLLQKRHGFVWLPSAFLFVPGPVENLCRRYGFPPFTYFLAWCYARVFVFFAQFRATGFVLTNEADFHHFSRRFRARRLFPFYGGVNVDQIPQQSLAQTRDVVFCSRLCEQKGIMGFLDIWKIVHERCPSARFTVIGNGAAAFEARLKAKAVQLGVADSIDWLGYVNGRDKYAIYRSARVMVHPTVYDNNGMVAAEALCCGLPVVMYDLPSLRNVYSVGCAKVPYGDTAAFAAKIVELLSDPAVRTATMPTADQVAELRAEWNWPNRVARFRMWMEELEK